MVPKVSIIIAVGVPGKYVTECVEHCLKLDYPDFEIIVLPDEDWKPPEPSVRVIPTGKVRPAEKRDRGVEVSSGEIVAIIDDDAYPVNKDWLAKAVRHFEEDTVAAVGGPGITPPDDNLRQKISGWIYESPMVSGGFTYRYSPGREQNVDDYPTSNLIIRKVDFLNAGGFDTGYWPGEDTILCMKLTHELGKRIVYDPEVLVYHHRREIFAGHLKQIKSYALHRGFFARKFPKTSLRLSYFVPSLFVLFFFFGWLSIFLYPPSFKAWIFIMCIYIFPVLLSAIRSFHSGGFFGIVAGTFLTHITYGIWFIIGLFSHDLFD